MPQAYVTALHFHQQLAQETRGLGHVQPFSGR